MMAYCIQIINVVQMESSVSGARGRITMPLTVFVKSSFTTAVDFNPFGEIGEHDSLGNLCDRPDLGRKIRSEAVDDAGKLAPCTIYVKHQCLPTEFTICMSIGQIT